MTNLTPLQIEHLKQLLDEREAVLRAHLQSEQEAKEDFVQVASEAPDSGDSSFATLSIDLGNAAVGRDVVGLRAIELTRQRIVGGEYGECIQCGFEIPYERLMVQPTAARCAPCQNNYEHTHADAGTRGSL